MLERRKKFNKFLNGHDYNCDWQFEQYDTDCTCGFTRPRHRTFVPWYLTSESLMPRKKDFL